MRRESEIFRALGDETRLQIVSLLSRHSQCDCEIERILGFPQYTVSKHLLILRFAGLVDFKRQGVRIQYSLRRDDPSLAPLFRFLKTFLSSGEPRRPGRASPRGPAATTSERRQP